MLHQQIGVESVRVVKLPTQKSLPRIVQQTFLKKGQQLVISRHTVICNSDPRGRTKWYGTYTEEQYLAQRQSEERARWAASVRTLTGNQDQAAWPVEGPSPLDPPALLSGVTVVIMSPRKPVSVGTVARACGSFECEDLRIVMPRQESYITRHAKSASKGAQYILYRAGHYDSIAGATADCDVRIAFTRWAQASSPNVHKVDITGLTSHPAVRRVLEQPLLLLQRPPRHQAAADDAQGVSPPSPSACQGSDSTSSSTSSSSSGCGGDRSPSGGGYSSDSSALADSAVAGSCSGRGGQDVSAACAAAGDDGGTPSGCGSSSNGTGEHCGTSSASASSSSRHDSSDDNNTTCSSRSTHSCCSSSGGSSGTGTSVDRGPAEAESAPPVQHPAPPPRAAPVPKVALVFGREELGMSDEEVEGCEMVCEVPMGRLQESLSLSHAVSIALCGLYQARLQHLAATGQMAALNAAGSHPQTGQEGTGQCNGDGRHLGRATVAGAAVAVADGEVAEDTAEEE